jgi:hypothetical protein
VLFFEEAIQPLESIFNGFLLHQLWFRLTFIILFRSPPKKPDSEGGAREAGSKPANAAG